MQQRSDLKSSAVMVLAAATAAMMSLTLFLIVRAPAESTMGLVQKIFYIHVPAWMAMGAAILVSGIASAVQIFRSSERAEHLALAATELAVIFGACGLITGPIWARKAWGVWWTWDPKLTTALTLEMILLSSWLVRRYAGDGSAKLASVIGLFGLAVSPFAYLATVLWRTNHPATTVVPSLGAGMFSAFWCSSATFLLLFLLLLTLRVRLANLEATLNRAYRSMETDV